MRVLAVETVTFEVRTDGNFSLLSKEWEYSQEDSRLGLGFLQGVLCEFEDKFGLKVISWEVQDHPSLKLVQILVNHEPKEKAEVVQLPKFETVTRLLGV
jgi:hypothetical protein